MVKCPSDILPKRKYYGKMSFWTLYLIDFGYGKMSPNFLGKVSPPGIFEFWHMVKCHFSELIKCLQLVKCRISEKNKISKVSSSKTNKVSTLHYGKMSNRIYGKMSLRHFTKLFG